MISSYRDLEIWRRSMELVVRSYRLCDRFPRSEEFGLMSQVRRSAVSIAANIAEGHGRETTGEYIQHLGIAYGSLMELETLLDIAGRLGYAKEDEIRQEMNETAQIGRMINALMCRLRERRRRKWVLSPLTPGP